MTIQQIVLDSQGENVSVIDKNQTGSMAGGRKVLILSEGRNLFKGALWSILAFKVAGLTLAMGLWTAFIGSATFAGLAVEPPVGALMLAITVASVAMTWGLVALTASCAENALHHLSSSQNKLYYVP